MDSFCLVDAVSITNLLEMNVLLYKIKIVLLTNVSLTVFAVLQLIYDIDSKPSPNAASDETESNSFQFEYKFID